ncbi:MAG: class I SAM-dependent methyltransferase [Actinomycetota bacterium]|nr:class I SAM-dependent methyltransferase [Actinomycetota bacterium]
MNASTRRTRPDEPLMARLVPADPYHNQLHRRVLARQIVDAARCCATGRVLDVGCGTKPYAEVFLSQGCEYVGLDVEDRGGVDVVGTALDIPFDPESFDTVFSSQVLEHVRDPFRMLAECARVLRPGGYLILTAPFSWQIHEEPNDYFRFSEYGLRELSERAGLAVESIEPMGGIWVNVATSISYFLFWQSHRKGRLNRLACRTVQRAGASLDRRYHWPQATNNYVLIARKPE